MEMIHLDQVLDEFFLVVGHLVMATWLVEKTLEQIGRIPALGTHHEGGDVGQPALQATTIRSPIKRMYSPRGSLPVHGHVEIDLAQLLLEPIQSGKLPFDGPYGVEILGELLLILPAQSRLSERASSRTRSVMLR